MIRQQDFVQPSQLTFKDDGIFPNSPLPLLFYHQTITPEAQDPASIFEERFAENDWTNSWRDGVYSFPRYHSTSHEVLGVYSGPATLRLGGGHGKNVKVHAGDVIVIPAGVAHQDISASDDFGVVGAYPGGRHWDLLRDYQASDRRLIIILRLCRCRRTMRFTEPKVHYEAFGIH